MLASASCTPTCSAKISSISWSDSSWGTAQEACRGSHKFPVHSQLSLRSLSVSVKGTCTQCGAARSHQLISCTSSCQVRELLQCHPLSKASSHRCPYTVPSPCATSGSDCTAPISAVSLAVLWPRVPGESCPHPLATSGLCAQPPPCVHVK